MAGSGAIDACCVILDLPRAHVESKLPEGFGLDSSADATTHPVVLVFSRQSQVRPAFVPFGGLSYLEFFELIPFVRHDSDDSVLPEQFSFMPYLLLDRLPPVVIGSSLYGFNKQLASIQGRENSFDIRSQLGRIEAVFVAPGLPGTLSDFSDTNLRQMIEPPQVSQMPDGSFVYSLADFHLDAATVQPLSGQIRIGQPFTHHDGRTIIACDSLLVGKGDAPLSTVAESIRTGGRRGSDAATLRGRAFRLATRWSLSMPFASPTTGSIMGSLSLRSFADSYSRAVLGRIAGRRR
jgi:hypothetical protein